MSRELILSAKNGLQLKSTDTAEEAGLRYVSDAGPGWRRRRFGKGFVYFDKSGNKISNPYFLKRLRGLRIPPAWRDVWICPVPNGHIQATGTDAKGRKQYIYHTKWHDVRNSTKFERILQFAEALPYIRLRVEEDLRKKPLSREKVAAIVVTLLEKTMIRVGNAEYMLQNDSYGLTTLKDDHITVEGSKISFFFKGKSGKQWELDLYDRRLARLVKQCQDLPGQDLFQYIDEDGNMQSISSGDINSYLKNITEYDFTAKDFRTWGGTVRIASILNEMGPSETESAKKRNISRAVVQSARILSNTPAVCRKYYIHPDIINSYMDDTLFDFFKTPDTAVEDSQTGLNKEEIGVISLLKNKNKERNIIS